MAKQSFTTNAAKIKIIGIGGGGCNAVTRMSQAEIKGVDCFVANTDAQSLYLYDVPNKIQLGEKLTRGLGAGGDPEKGAKALEESRDDVAAALDGADMIFITAGMGGGTGTGGAPIVAEIAKQTGALTIAIVTKPFSFEGVHRQKQAEEGIAHLLGKVDTLIIIPNDRLLALCDYKTAVGSAFKIADDVLKNGVQAIAEVITVPGMINLDYADVKSIMANAGPAWMAVGTGTGQNRATDAAKAALSCPLLDISVEGSKGVLFTVAGSSSLTLFEVNEAAEVLKKAVDPQANIIFGVVIDPDMGNDMRITMIATGFANRAGLPRAKDEAARLAVKDLKEEQLDIPAFLRGGSSWRRPTMPQPTEVPSKVRMGSGR